MNKIKTVRWLMMLLFSVAVLSLSGCIFGEDEDEDAPEEEPTEQALTVTNAAAKVYNFTGAEKGAYDLVAGEEKGSADAAADKDLHDMTVAGSMLAFSAKWKSMNGGMFVTGAMTDYDGATKTSLMAAYNAGTPVAETPVLAAGSIVIVKLGNNRGWAIIKVTAVDMQDGTGSEKGSVTFEYKYAAADTM